MRAHDAIGFWDHRHAVASAQHIDDMTFRSRKDGSVLHRVYGLGVLFTLPTAGDLTVTVGLNPPQDPTTSQCFTGTGRFHGGTRRLRFP